MLLHIIARGKIGRSPEAELVERYLKRLTWPHRMTERELSEGYAWCYRRLFSHSSIWRRRPADWRAVPAYLGMSYLYKRANWLWPLLIRYLGRSREMWAWLLKLPPPEWPPVGSTG